MTIARKAEIGRRVLAQQGKGGGVWAVPDRERAAEMVGRLSDASYNGRSTTDLRSFRPMKKRLFVMCITSRAKLLH
jgi:hypothetical protein